MLVFLLPETVEFVIVNVAPLSIPPPPPPLAVLFDTVLPKSVKEPELYAMPPPKLLVVLPSMTQFVMVIVPLL